VQRKAINDYLAYEAELVTADQQKVNATTSDSVAEESLYLPAINR
jgi:hypothetical protein